MPGMACGAERLNAGLLHGFENRAGILSFGPVLAVDWSE